MMKSWCRKALPALLALLVCGTAVINGQGSCPPSDHCLCTASLMNCDPSALGGRGWVYNRTMPSPISATVQTLIVTGNDLTTLLAEELRNATGLTKLQVDNNRLKYLSVDTFKYQRSLQELDLSNNHLRTLPLGIFANMTSLTSLSLHSNWISTLPAEGVDHVFSDLVLTTLKKITLHGNSLHCDCTLQWLPNYATTLVAAGILDQPGQVQCQLPARVTGVALTQLETLTPRLVYNCTQPAIVSAPVESVVNSTTSVTLSCATSGSPVPEVAWYQDNARVDIDYYRLNLAQDGSLVISDSRHSDEGNYHCNVTNEKGFAASGVAFLKVDEVTCFNQAVGGDETDMDCGGPLCNPCALTQKCLADRDCVDSSVCLGSHQLTSSLLYVSSANDRYLTCAPNEEPGTTLLQRLRASLRGRDNPLEGINGTEDLAALVQELHGEIITQLEVPRSYISNVRLEAQARHRRPLYKLRFSMSSSGAVMTKTSLERQLHRGQLHGTVAYSGTGNSEVQLVF
ncbi:peroxidasin homolog [Sycon ciliatum]|uniref:peroxidasin homolog n=1 Tax=Sycon ciliatum TaxID=27933 RepID=UPI0031F67EC0